MAGVQASTKRGTTTALATTTTTAKATTTTAKPLVTTTTAAPVTTTTTAPAPAATPASLVRLRVTIKTTSDWTQVRLLPGRAVASKVVSQTAGVSGYTELGNGWQIKSAGASNTLVVDTVYVEGTGAPTIAVRVQKGWVGSTTVTVSNTTAAAVQVFSMVDSLNTGTDTNYQVQSSTTRATFMGTTTLALPHADSRKLTLAIYYPWFFGAGYSDPTLADKPSFPRSTTLPSGIQSYTQQAHDNGIDGFLVSYGGAAANGAAFGYALDSAATVGNVAAPYIEITTASPDAAGTPNGPVVEQWVREALSLSSKPAFLKGADGIPVAFIYQMQLLPVDYWTSLSARLAAEGKPVHFEGEAPLPAYSSAAWGVHRYSVVDSLTNLQNWSVNTSFAARAMSAIDSSVKPQVFAATVSPGFNDTLLRGLDRPVIDRGLNGAQYDGSWDAALAGSPDWVIVSTWNEWWEGTSVEPGVKNGDLALRQTALRSAAWKALP